MKKILIISLILSFLSWIISFIVVRVDLSFHDYENKMFYDLKDEFFFFTNKTKKQGTCDVECSVYRWYPFQMRTETRVTHYDMRWNEINILYNLLFYFSISFFTLNINNLYIYFKKDSNLWKN